MNIWFATNNSHKKKELEAILGTVLKIPSEAGIAFDPEETGASFCENALIKARELKKLLRSNDNLVIADDSGLCVDSLDGRPGVFSARYGETDGKKLTSLQKNLLLLEELGDTKKRNARFVCAMVLLMENDRFFIVQETLEGEIVEDRGLLRGDGGFGYDPVFIPCDEHANVEHAPLERTLAEFSDEEKNLISHRGKAGKYIASILKNF